MDNEFTWQPDISQHCLLTVFNAADLGEVDVKSQEGHAAQKGHGAHKDAIITGVLVAVEDTVLLHFVGAVDVALVGDATEDHDGEKLQRRQEERMGLWEKKTIWLRPQIWRDNPLNLRILLINIKHFYV